MKRDSSNSSQHKRSSKGKQLSHYAQKIIVFKYLQNHLATASMVEAETGVKQKNICRYKREFEEADLLWEVVEKRCKITGCFAWYLTTDPNLAPKKITIQTKMF